MRCQPFPTVRSASPPKRLIVEPHPAQARTPNCIQTEKSSSAGFSAVTQLGFVHSVAISVAGAATNHLALVTGEWLNCKERSGAARWGSDFSAAPFCPIIRREGFTLPYSLCPVGLAGFRRGPPFRRSDYLYSMARARPSPRLDRSPAPWPGVKSPGSAEAVTGPWP